MLHDIGTTDDNLRGTRLSFEFRSGLLALEMLRKRPESETEADGAGAVGGLATREQAESVAEAVFRHQDLHEKGSITAVGQLLQMATILGCYPPPPCVVVVPYLLYRTVHLEI